MRARPLSIALVVLATAAGVAPGAAAAATRYVAATGDNANACTMGAPCASIQGAIDKGPLNSGDVIDVGPGQFTQDFSLNDPGVTVRGAKAGVSGTLRTPGSAGETDLRGAATNSLRVTAGSTTFDGVSLSGSGLGVSGADFTFTNGIAREARSGTGIASNGANLTIRSSLFTDTLFGIYQAGAGVDVQGSTFQKGDNPGSTSGIVYRGPGSLGTVAFNRFSGVTTAIDSTGQSTQTPSNFFGCNSGPGTTGCAAVQGVDASAYLQLRLTAGSATAQVGSQVPLQAGFVTSGTTSAPAGISAFPATSVGFSASPSTASVTPATASTTAGVAGSALSSTATGSATATAALDNATANASVLFTAVPVTPTPMEPTPMQPIPMQPQPAPPSAPIAPRDTTAPRLTDVGFSSTTFTVDAKARASALRKGSKLSLTLSEPATVIFVTEQRVGKRWRKIRIFGKRLPGGRSTVDYSGRIKPRGKTRSLKPGRYRLRMRPSDRAGIRGTVTTRSFRIAK